MPELTTCWDCGRPISTAARQCPGCETRYPFGVTCFFCQQKLAYRDCWNWGGKFGHPSCVDKILVVPMKCCTCGAALPVEPNEHENLPDYEGRYGNARGPCPSCGQPNPRRFVTHCYRCRLPLFGDDSIVRKVENKENHRADMRNYHAACAPPEVAPPSRFGCPWSAVAMALIAAWLVLSA